MKKMMLLMMLLLSAISNADMPSTHGVLLFGDKVSYASHLPMFHEPHDYQVILKLALEDLPRSVTVRVHYEESKKNKKNLFTLVPETMDLTEIINGTKTSFMASIYEGHFERGGRDLGQAIVT